MKNTNEKIKIVVIQNNTLAYILPQTPNLAFILKTSILKGSRFNEFSSAISIDGLNVRLANINDFNDYRICPNGYLKDNNYEFIKT
jgi:hypothetical protein